MDREWAFLWEQDGMKVGMTRLPSCGMLLIYSSIVSMRRALFVICVVHDTERCLM
jgi:hypothetical protein